MLFVCIIVRALAAFSWPPSATAYTSPSLIGDVAAVERRFTSAVWYRRLGSQAQLRAQPLARIAEYREMHTCIPFR